ncbi:hypothetical protein [Kutzneria sp. NPDC052558]|uniref:hypothetical protein n=1 Tax=Kutzneria sp. NPDC052558 TaxID=3364121 RepID=UPI0037C6BFA0
MLVEVSHRASPSIRSLIFRYPAPPISDVHVGDQVLATDPTTGQSADKPVTDVIVLSAEA